MLSLDDIELLFARHGVDAVQRRAGDAARARAADGAPRRADRGATTRSSPPACCTTSATCSTTRARRRRCAASTTRTSTSRCRSCAACSPTRCSMRSSCTSTPSATCASVDPGVLRRASRTTRSAASRCRAAPFDAAAAAALHRPARRARRGAAAPVGRPRQAGRAGDAAARPFPPARGGCARSTPADAPALTWPVVLAVLFGALLHASWNALIKSGGDKARRHGAGARPRLRCVGAAACCSGSACRARAAGPASRPRWSSTSATTSRWSAPTATASWASPTRSCAASRRCWSRCAAATLIGEAPSTSPPGSASSASRSASRWSAWRIRARRCITARRSPSRSPTPAIIAAYTVVDGLGVRTVGRRAALRDGAVRARRHLPIPSIVWLRRSAEARRASRAPTPPGAGRWRCSAARASIGSYAIALWAMTRAPVAAVAALRETSVLFAAVLGTVLLKERFGVQRAIGTLGVVSGRDGAAARLSPLRLDHRARKAVGRRPAALRCGGRRCAATTLRCSGCGGERRTRPRTAGSSRCASCLCSVLGHAALDASPWKAIRTHPQRCALGAAQARRPLARRHGLAVGHSRCTLRRPRRGAELRRRPQSPLRRRETGAAGSGNRSHELRRRSSSHVS